MPRAFASRTASASERYMAVEVSGEGPGNSNRLYRGGATEIYFFVADAGAAAGIGTGISDDEMS